MLLAEINLDLHIGIASFIVNTCGDTAGNDLSWWSDIEKTKDQEGGLDKIIL